jgi:hypothetical protein
LFNKAVEVSGGNRNSINIVTSVDEILRPFLEVLDAALLVLLKERELRWPGMCSLFQEDWQRC